MIVISHVYAGIKDRGFRGAVLRYPEVRHVAGVRAVGIVEAMMLHVGIEMRACRGECRPFAFRDRMDVHGAFTRRQILQVELDLHPTRFLFTDRGGSYALPLGVFHLYCYGFGCRVKANTQ